MKKTLLFFTLALSGLAGAQAQGQPYIGTPTLIPQSPTAVDVVKIVTHVITPNQSIIVDVNTFSVSSNPNEIRIRSCYWQGMLPATQDYFDTLVIGQIPAGTYSIKQKAYLSTTQQHCSPVDSNMVTTTFSVATLTGLDKLNEQADLRLFPNPAADKLYIKAGSDFKVSTVSITSVSGSLVKNITFAENNYVDVADLEPGIYFIRVSDGKQEKILRFIKSSTK